MAGFLTVSLALLLIFAHGGDAQSTTSRITINPPSLSLNSSTPEATVEIECRPPVGASPSLVGNMNILRVKDGSSTEQPLAGARSVGNDDSAQVDLGANIPGSSAEGSLGEGMIKFIMTRAGCDDAGMYICRVIYYASNTAIAPTTATSTANLTASRRPEQVIMTATPDQPQYSFNASLLLRCNAAVGTVDDDTQVEWMWDYKDSQGFFPDWQPVPDTEGSTNLESNNPEGTCSARRQEITLQRYLTTADTGRSYRCYVRVRRGFSTDYTQFAGEYTVQQVLAAGEDPGTGGNTGNDDSSTSKANVGGIVGGVIGGLIVIVIIVVLVYFLVIRKRRNRGDDYNTGEHDPSKPADEQPSSYPTSYPSDNAGVGYSKPPNRFRDRENGMGDRDRRYKNEDGLHYADLDLVRKPPTDDSESSVSSRHQPTEYASIRLF